MTFKITRVQRLRAVIAISMCFFIAEISSMFIMTVDSYDGAFNG